MNRRGLLAVTDYHLERQKILRQGKSDPYGEPRSRGLPHGAELPDSPLQVLRWEREYVGAYLSDDPLNYHNATSVAGDIMDGKPDKNLSLIGFVQNHEFKHTRKGTPWSRFSIVDLSGPARAFCFGQLARDIGEGFLGHFKGLTTSRDEDIEFKVTAFRLLERY